MHQLRTQLTAMSSLAAAAAAHAAIPMTMTPVPFAEDTASVSRNAVMLAELGLADDPPAAEAPQAAPSTGARRWEVPAVVVQGDPISSLREEDLIGPYSQPRWTASRLFATTRIFVLPEREISVEGWARATINRSSQGGGTNWGLAGQLAVGLPGRFEFSAAFEQERDAPTDASTGGGILDVSWAIADWNEIWGNPTLSFGYATLGDQSDEISPAILFGGEAAQGWHWGVNFGVNWQLSGTRDAEYELTSALAHTVLDERLSLGVESVLALTTTKGSRDDFATSFLIGPSVHWKPLPEATVNFAPLIGTTDESPSAEIYLNLGWEF